MQQIQVPQFIDVEDKIFGPLTLKQFLYFIGAGVVAFFLYHLLVRVIGLPVGFFMIFGAVLLGLAVALAFVRVNDRPFVFVLMAALRFYSGSQLYLWKQEKRLASPSSQKKKLDPEVAALVKDPRLSQSRLKELAWSLDIKKSLDES